MKKFIVFILVSLLISSAFADEKRVEMKTTLCFSLDKGKKHIYIDSVPIEEKTVKPNIVLWAGEIYSIGVSTNVNFFNYPKDSKSHMSVVVVYESFDSKTEVFVFDKSEGQTPWNFGEMIPKISLGNCTGGGGGAETQEDYFTSDCGYASLARYDKPLSPGVYKVYTALEGEVVETNRKKVSNVTEYFYSGSFVLLPELKNEIEDSIF